MSESLTSAINKRLLECQKTDADCFTDAVT